MRRKVGHLDLNRGVIKPGRATDADEVAMLGLFRFDCRDIAKYVFRTIKLKYGGEVGCISYAA